MTDQQSLSLNDIVASVAAHPRLRVTFHSHTFAAGDLRVPGAPNWLPESTAINVDIPGNALSGVMRKVQDDGGIGAEMPDGLFVWLPWPVAAVTLRAAPETPSP